MQRRRSPARLANVSALWTTLSGLGVVTVNCVGSVSARMLPRTGDIWRISCRLRCSHVQTVSKNGTSACLLCFINRDRSNSAGVAFVMGESVWWLSGFGACRAAAITKIDSTGDPTSYEIQYAGEDRFRETIAKRLRHRLEPKLPDDTCMCPAPSCSANIAIPQLQVTA